MVNISGGGGQSSCRYILRERECLASFSNIATEKKSILSAVGKMEKMELEGSPELGITGRYDAKRMTKLIIMLPNEMEVGEMEKKIKQVLRETGISKYPHVVAIHKGEDGEEGVTNRHAHVNYFERRFEKGDSKKNRAFHAKDFVQQVTKVYQSVFGLEAGQDTKRERLPRQEYELATMGKEIAKLEEQITLEKHARNERFRQRLNAGRNDSGQAQPTGGRTGIAGKDATSDFKPIGGVNSAEAGQPVSGQPKPAEIVPNDIAAPLRDLAETLRRDEAAKRAAEERAERERAAEANKLAAERERAAKNTRGHGPSR